MLNTVYWGHGWLRVRLQKGSQQIECGVLFCMQNKPYLKNNELFQQIKSKLPNVNLSNEDIKRLLDNIPYQDLFKGYKNTKLKLKNGTFVRGMSLNLLYQIHWLDLSLSELLLKFSLETEKHLKAQLSNIVVNYGVDYEEYLSRFRYKNTSNKVLHKINEFIEADQDNYFSKAKEEYSGCIPSWYLIHHLSLGQVINWYSILRPPAKQEIVNSFFSNDVRLTLNKSEDQKELFKSFLDYILEVRNKSAHGNKAIGLKLDTNLQNRLIEQTPFSPYFKRNKEKIIVSDIYNFFVIVIALSGIESFSVNIINDVLYYFQYNSSREKNPLYSLGLTVYDLYNVNQDNLNKLIEFVNQKHNLNIHTL